MRTKTRPVTKKELISEMVQRCKKMDPSFTKKQCEIALKAFLETVTEMLKKGNKVQLIPFGSWEIRERKERKGRNPKTREEIIIPARRVPVFKPGKMLKEVVK